MSHMGRWKKVGNAAQALALAEDMGRAHAIETGTSYPIPPQRYGGGRQPEPREAYYHRYYIEPLGDLLPANDNTIRLGGPRMNGHVDFDELSDNDKDKIDPSGRRNQHNPSGQPGNNRTPIKRLSSDDRN